MTERATGAPLLRPLITTKGLEAAVQASTLGKAVKIVNVGLTATPGAADVADTSLPGAVMLPVADGRLVNDHQVNVSALLPDTFQSMNICGIAFYLEDGTMFAVYREPEPFLEHTAGTTLLVGMDLVMDNIPSESVIVESTGANLILGDWVPVERTVNGKALKTDIALTAADVGAVNLNGDKMKGRLWFVDDHRAIEPIGDNLQVTANLGRIILKSPNNPTANVAGVEYTLIHTGNLPKTDLSGYVPITRKVNKKALNEDIDLKAADVDAVGRTGNQSMAGQLDGVRFTATDPYAFVSKLRPKQGLFIGNSASDKRTIVGGGGDAVGDASGAVHFRPNGIDDPAGEVIVSPAGTVTASAAPTVEGHLANKGYVDSAKQSVIDVFKKYLPLTGGTLTGGIIAAVVKAAIHLKDKASLSFQDADGTMLHAFATGQALRFAHGNSGENRILDIAQHSVDSVVPIFANTSVVTRSSDGTKWLSIDAPTAGNPYIASRSAGEASSSQAIVFGKDDISLMKTVRMNNAQIRTDAGLKFSPNDDMGGISWGLGIHATDRTLGLHKYVDGVWNSSPFWVDSIGNVCMNTLQVMAAADVSRLQVRNAGVAAVELHEPGKHAVMMHKPQGTAKIRFSNSNGSGVPALSYVDIGVEGVTAYGQFVNSWANNRGWHDSNRCSFWAGKREAGDGELFGVVGEEFVVAGSYDAEMFYGYQTHTDINRSAHTFACQGSGRLNVWSLRNGGRMESPGGWVIEPNGDLFAPRINNNVIDWAVNTFSLTGHNHTAHEGNMSMVQGRHSEVGTYMFAAFAPAGGGACVPGTQVAGAHLHPAACAEFSQNRVWSLPGTWMCCGHVDANTDDRWDDRSTLWFRVA